MSGELKARVHLLLINCPIIFVVCVGGQEGGGCVDAVALLVEVVVAVGGAEVLAVQL